jgi:membrane protein DedA with SNARE-associated domain/rhodanese-related sulfurtransferase
MFDLSALSHGYIEVIVGVNTVIHELGVPVPLMPTALYAGAQASAGQVNAIALVIIITAGALIGNSAWFAAGRVFGGRVLTTLCKVSMSPDTCVGRTENAFTRWGRWSLVFGHFIPGVSLVGPPLAGALGMQWSTFLGFTAIGAALYGGVLVGAGMLLKNGILALTDTVFANASQSLAIVLLACAAYIAWKWWRRRAAGAPRVPRISVAELREAMGADSPPVIIDVRGESTRQSDRRQVPGALPATVENVVRFVDGRPKSVQVVLYCACPNDASAALAAQLLIEAGYTQARALRGGLDAWFSVEGTQHARSSTTAADRGSGF